MKYLIALFTLLLISISYGQGLPTNGFRPAVAQPTDNVTFLGGHTTDLEAINSTINKIIPTGDYLVGWELFVHFVGLDPIPGFGQVIGSKTKTTSLAQKLPTMNFDTPPVVDTGTNYYHYQVGLKSKTSIDLGYTTSLTGQWHLQSFIPQLIKEVSTAAVYYSKAYYAPADLEFEGELYHKQKDEKQSDALILFERIGPGTTPLREEVLVEDGKIHATGLAPGYYKIEVLEPKKCAGVIEKNIKIDKSLNEDLTVLCNNPYTVTLNFNLDSSEHSIEGKIIWDNVFIEYAQRTREDYSDDDWLDEYNPIASFTHEDAMNNDPDGEEGEIYDEEGERITIPFRNKADIVVMTPDDLDMANGLINLSFDKSTKSTPEVYGNMFDELECSFDSGDEPDYFFARRPSLSPKGWLDDIMDDDLSDDDLSDGDDEETEMPMLEVQATDDPIETLFMSLMPYRIHFSWGINIICKHPDPEQYGEVWITLDSSLMNFDKEGQTFESFSSQLNDDDSVEVLTAIKRNESFVVTTEKEFDYGLEDPVRLTVTIEGEPNEEFD